MNETIYRAADGSPRSLGRDTAATVGRWPEIVAAVGYAPRVFNGPVPSRSPDVRRFYHASYLNQSTRGFCVGFNLTGTAMTRLRIPDGATADAGEPLPKVALSPLWTYAVGRRACRAAGYNPLQLGDGLIGSVAAKGLQGEGFVPLEQFPSPPRAVDSYNRESPPPAALEPVAQHHRVLDLKLAGDFDHGLELNAAGFPLALASAIPEGMMHSDPATGVFSMSGPIVGGHLYQMLDHDRERDVAWIAQAWVNWGARSSDPEYAPMGGYTQLGYCRLSDLARYFSDRAMSTGSSEIICLNTVEGFGPPIVDYSAL